MKSRLSPSLGLVPLLAVLAVPSAFSAESIYGALDIGFIEAGNTSPAYALQDPDSDGDPNGTEKFTEFGFEFSPRIAIGWNTEANGTVELAFWMYDADADDSVNFGANDGWASLETPWYSEFDGNADTASAEAEVKANVIDVTWSNGFHKADNWGIEFLAGLRYASLDNNLDVTYTRTTDIQTEELESEATGYGIRTGLRAAASFFNGHLNLSLAAGISLLKASVDSSFVETDVDGANVQYDIDNSQDSVATILEARLLADIPIWNGIAGRVGYEFQQWNGMAGFPTANDGHGGASNHQEDRAITFDGFILGLNYTHAF